MNRHAPWQNNKSLEIKQINEQQKDKMQQIDLRSNRLCSKDFQLSRKPVGLMVLSVVRDCEVLRRSFLAFAPRARKIHSLWDFRRSQYPWLIYSFLSLPIDGLRWTDNKCWTVKTLDHQTVCRRKSISTKEGAPGALSLAASIKPSGEERNLILPCHHVQLWLHSVSMPSFICRKWRGIYTCAIYCLSCQG